MEAQNVTSRADVVADQRECPTVGGEPGSLITHVIAPASCLQRQRELYHKCHRCDYRGKPASFRLGDAPSSNGLNGASRNGR